MKRLTAIDRNALRSVDARGSICPGTEPGAASEITHVLNGLARRKLVEMEASDDGPVFTLTRMGVAEARK